MLNERAQVVLNLLGSVEDWDSLSLALDQAHKRVLHDPLGVIAIRQYGLILAAPARISLNLPARILQRPPPRGAQSIGVQVAQPPTPIGTSNLPGWVLGFGLWTLDVHAPPRVERVIGSINRAAPKSEVRGQRAEDRGQRTEGRGQRAEGGGRRAEGR